MPGIITFKPIEANLNHDADLIGKADPYCMFLVGDQRIKGQVSKSGGKHPIWDDAITVPTGSQPICMVELKDKDILKDDKLGSFEIDLREVESQGRLKKWYPIFHKNKPAGEILMEAIYSPGQGGLQQGMGMPLQQGMGMPLQQGMGMPLQQGMGMPVQQGYGAPLQQTHIPVQQHVTHNIIGAAPISGVTQTQHVVTKETVIAPTQHAFIQEQGYSGYGYGESMSEQYAREALIRGIDPLGTHLHYAQPTPLQSQLPLNQGFIGNQIAPNTLPNTFGNNLPNTGMNMPPNQF